MNSKHIERWTKQQRNVARHDRDLLDDVKGFRLAKEQSSGQHVCHVSVMSIETRDATLKNLQETSIGASILYPIPVHLSECFAELGYLQGDFTMAEQIGAEELSLPIYPEITREQMSAVVTNLKSFISD